MICDNCLDDRPDKIMYMGDGTWSCPKCARKRPASSVGYTKVMVGNKWHPSMTYAMQQNVATRKVRSDGKIRPDPKWQSSHENRRIEQ